MFQFREKNDSLFKGKRGHFAVGIYQPKYSLNCGLLWRTAAIYGADYLFVINGRFIQYNSDTMKTHLHMPIFQFKDFKTFKESLYPNTDIVAIEMTDKAKMINEFHHPERACYLLGNESLGIPEHILDECKYHVKLPGEVSLNVSVAGSIVLHERWRQNK